MRRVLSCFLVPVTCCQACLRDDEQPGGKLAQDAAGEATNMRASARYREGGGRVQGVQDTGEPEEVESTALPQRDPPPSVFVGHHPETSKREWLWRVALADTRPSSREARTMVGARYGCRPGVRDSITKSAVAFGTPGSRPSREGLPEMWTGNPHPLKSRTIRSENIRTPTPPSNHTSCPPTPLGRSPSLGLETRVRRPLR